MIFNKKKTLCRSLEKRLMLDASITAIGGNVLWLDAADQDTLIDNDGDNVSSGNFDGQIAQWNDKSGNANNLSHTTGSRQPTYIAAGKNGNDLVSFDGNDALYITDALQSGLDLNGNGMTLIAVTNATTTAGARILINKESSYEMAFNGGKYQSAISTSAPGGWAWGGTSAITTGWHMTGFTYDDTTWDFRQESALTQQIAPANNQTGNILPSNNIFTVGARGAATPTGSFFAGDMAEVILFDRALTDSERLDIEIYLSNKWDITLNNAAPTITKSTGELAQGEAITVNAGMLTSTDPDGADADLIYTLSSLATNGTLKLNGIDLNATDTFTQQDVIDGDLTFIHDGSATAGSFDFTVNDQINTTALTSFTFGFNISETTNNPVTLNEGGDITIDTADLEYGPPPDLWYDTDWQYRQRITIDSTNIGSNLTDFTVFLDETNMNAAFWADVKANGSDIVLTSSDGVTKLSRELIDIDTALETMELHVKLPTIDAASNTNFYLYFGNAAGVEGNDITAWNGDYAGVWHLNEVAGNASDATGNGNIGTMNGGLAQGVAGAIGKGVTLDGVNDFINITINKAASTTFSFWSTWNGAQGDMPILVGNNGAGPDLYVSGGKISWNTWNGTANAFANIPGDANDGNFHHYQVVIDPASTELYYDGALLGTAGYADPSGTNIFKIGGIAPYLWGGSMDEVRVNNTALTADWAFAEYTNQKTPATFYSVSGIQTAASSLTYTLTDVTDNGVVQLNGVDLLVTDSFTQNDIDSGFLSYLHDDTNTTTDLFSFTVSDGSGNITGTRDFNFIIKLLADDGGYIPPEADDNSDTSSQNNNKIEPKETRTHELVRSSFSGDGQSNFYGESISEIVRDGSTMNIDQTLNEINNSNGTPNIDINVNLPDGTPQIMSVFEQGINQEEELPAEDKILLLEKLPEQINEALLFEHHKFNVNVTSFLQSIAGHA